MAPPPHEERMVPDHTATPREEVIGRILVNELVLLTCSPLSLRWPEGRPVYCREYPLSNGEAGESRTLTVGYDAPRKNEVPVIRTVSIDSTNPDGVRMQQTLHLNAVRNAEGLLSRPMIYEEVTEKGYLPMETRTSEVWYYTKPGDFEPFVGAVAELARVGLQN